MKPALSVIFFTVSSGTGLGLLIWLVMARLAHSTEPSTAWWMALAIAMVLLTAGLLSSTQHLANPKNAWRAFTRFATSWLSREGVFAVLIYPIVAVYALALANGWSGLALVMGLVVIALALVVLICTAMIYACLKTIPRWNNWQTIALYPLFGLMAGALLLMALMPDVAALVIRWLALVCLVAAALVKFMHQTQFDADAGISLSDALKQSWGRPKLLDVGHTHENFLTREFGFDVAPATAVTLTLLMWVLAFVIPMLIAIFAPWLAWVALGSCLAGLFVERWLFFAQAKHVVRLYHGSARV
ncbi:MAG: DmsC/YnfH family molybdoenzyme membrane anchor subunit [Burkholderiaceae bacterium]